MQRRSGITENSVEHSCVFENLISVYAQLRTIVWLTAIETEDPQRAHCGSGKTSLFYARHKLHTHYSAELSNWTQAQADSNLAQIKRFFYVLSRSQFSRK